MKLRARSFPDLAEIAHERSTRIFLRPSGRFERWYSVHRGNPSLFVEFALRKSREARPLPRVSRKSAGFSWPTRGRSAKATTGPGRLGVTKRRPAAS